MKKIFGIKIISEACGAAPQTIRTWETRYKAFSPDRSSGGQRLYCLEDIEKAKILMKLIGVGHSISQIAKLDLNSLQQVYKDSFELNETTDNKDKLNSGENKKPKEHFKLIFKFLKSYDLDNINAEIQHLRLSVGAKEFIFDVVLPIISQTGTLVASGEYSVTQEHIVSLIVKDQLSQLAIPQQKEKYKESIVLATPNGNRHELSILIADILCRLNRYPTKFIGSSHPSECLGEAINAFGSRLLVMGVINSDHWDYQKNIDPYLLDLDSKLTGNVTVILGGGWEVPLSKFKNITQVKFLNSLLEFDEALSLGTLLENSIGEAKKGSGRKE